MGNPILVLHGAEPDAHWESFTTAISEIRERAGQNRELCPIAHGPADGILGR